MSGGFFRGTSADQDTRLSNKQAKLLKTQKFARELDHLVDMTEVKMDVMRPWIANRVTELLGFEDELLINFIYGLLDGKDVNGKEVQISLTGFMEKNTAKFMKELWTLLLSAQQNASGVPQQFLDAKEEETRKKMKRDGKKSEEKIKILSTMPTIASHNSILVAKSETTGDTARSNGDLTPQKRRLRSDAAAVHNKSPMTAPMKLKSTCRCINSSPNAAVHGIENESREKLASAHKSPVKKKLSKIYKAKPNWNPQDLEQMSAAKEALHVSTAPSTVVCRDDEQTRVFEFCKKHLEEEKAGSLYVCGCPGTGKSLSLEKVRHSLVDWAKEAGLQPPDVLSMNCTQTHQKFSARKKFNGSTSALQHLQNLYSQKQQSSGMKMMIIIADELDYLITRDRAVLHDLFMLTTFPFSRCILIGIANAIDLADRFLPRLQLMNCKPLVVTFRAYSKDQIIRILQERLMALPYVVFQPQALELCARKVAAASGDMRKALSVCRSAIEMLEAELRESAGRMNSASAEQGLFDQQAAAAFEFFNSQVRVDHMAVALSNTFKLPVVDTIQSLPQHQQIILCSAVKSFRGGKKDTTVGDLNKSYMDICKTSLIPAVGTLEFLSMCRVLHDQGLLKLGQSREDKLKRVTLKADESDITFALHGVRFFRNCLQ